MATAQWPDGAFSRGRTGTVDVTCRSAPFHAPQPAAAARRAGAEAPRLKLELADDHCVAMAAKHCAVPLLPAIKHARSGARLQRRELFAAKPFGPIGHQSRMGRSGHRVLVDTEIGNEYPAGDI